MPDQDGILDRERDNTLRMFLCGHLALLTGHAIVRTLLAAPLSFLTLPPGNQNILIHEEIVLEYLITFLAQGGWTARTCL